MFLAAQEKDPQKESLLPQERVTLASAIISWFVENQLNTVIESFKWVFKLLLFILFYFICIDYTNTSECKNFIFASMR